MNSVEHDKWEKACQEEFEGLTKMGIWKLVLRPKDRKMVKCRWTYEIKSDGQYKAHLVTKRYTQVQGINILTGHEISIYEISGFTCSTP